ncbi:VOC family protein [Priestia megaterium]|uniref:VOC family protein n=1 Tax=Priestia megaterium TaxID=1404 RepID=UPI000BFA9807|nr:VOC family protein [Priestia megaterium]PFD99203.1 glyoxalase/bleomycin resistance/extradiol dioxygenase family protein [Priestia megaterium]PGY54508.1 glyoxalase/bleomycin resistance/extradiol dioxygenase family protein [Priestia megaterium]
MIKKVGQIMVYVNDQDQAVKFWTEKMGFQVMSEQNNEQGMKWIELAPVAGAETTIILHNKQLIAKMQPELNVGTPSLLFFTENVDELYRDLTAKSVTVGEIVSMPSGRVFNFSDSEGNYFAVMENTNHK